MGTGPDRILFRSGPKYPNGPNFQKIRTGPDRNYSVRSGFSVSVRFCSALVPSLTFFTKYGSNYIYLSLFKIS
uniref:Uncharacterized protein n=1 Tax=Daucus carota subsp. sativus TaxID=79200 RepID=A0A164VLI2_DAUCS